MNEKELNTAPITLCQVDWYRKHFFNKRTGNPIEPSHVYTVQLLEKLTPLQLYQLQNGSGNPIAEMYQINSSAGMAVNYYKLFEKTHKNLDVEFEWKQSVPLLKSSAPSNIDVKYEIEGVVHFVECKFLEPYNSDYHKNKKSYMDTKRYPFEGNKELWKVFLSNESKFKYYDFAQLCRHLMAIYRYYNEDEELRHKSIILESVTWKMTDAFMNHYASMGYDTVKLKERNRIIEYEKDMCNELFSVFLKSIHWDNCSFLAHHYNDQDMLDAIRKAAKFEDFKKQYFIVEE